MLTLLLIVGMIVWTGAAISLGFLKKETEIFQQTYEVENGTSLQVINKHGKITLKEWSEDSIEVYALKKTYWGREELKKIDIVVDQGSDFKVKTDCNERFPWVSVHIRMNIPENITVNRIEASNGDIHLEGITGDTTVHTCNGDITITDHTGSITADTSNGDIRLEDMTGDVDGETSNGDIRAENVAGVISASSSNGAITVKDSQAVNKIETSNGPISLEFTNVMENGCHITTSNGYVKLYISLALNADLKVKTSNGEIELHNDLTVMISKISDDQLNGHLGEGGPEIYVRTSNGDIDLYGRGM